MLFVKLFCLVTLSMIFLQDIRSRSVYWVYFPFFAGCLLWIRLHHPEHINPWWQVIILNLTLISVQLVLLTLYFSIKRKRITNITTALLGWGDVLFLLGLTVYFSAASLMFFYTFSLALSLIVWITLNAIKLTQTKKIPLAGFQALLLMLFLMAEWWLHLFDLGNDAWLYDLIRK